jgi:malonyl-CoA O-methyltransferase
MQTLLDKSKVAQSFSKAAITYDAAAAFQRDVGNDLFAVLEQYKPAEGCCASHKFLDLGCGTGYFSEKIVQHYNQGELYCLDIAQGMLKHARDTRKHQRMHWLCADAEALPLAKNSIDFVFSSLAIQWCENLDALFSQIQSVLAVNGVAVLATLGPKSLFELKEAWASVDEQRHVNRFISLDSLCSNLPKGLMLEYCEQQTKVVEYDKLKELTADLKNIGAHNINQGKERGLTGKTKVRQFKQAYEQFRLSNGKLPASYEVYYLVLRKEL